jgi:hypothetical protein
VFTPDRFVPLPSFPNAWCVVRGSRAIALVIRSPNGTQTLARETLGAMVRAIREISTLPDIRPVIREFRRVARRIENPAALGQPITPDSGALFRK